MAKNVIKVNVELTLNRKEYTVFRRTFDETTFKEFCSDYVDEMIKQTNPDAVDTDPHVRLQWLEVQNKRLRKKAAMSRAGI